MASNSNNTPRKSSDLQAQIEEENLWDLEDDWDDEVDQNSRETDETIGTREKGQELTYETDEENLPAATEPDLKQAELEPLESAEDLAEDDAKTGKKNEDQPDPKDMEELDLEKGVEVAEPISTDTDREKETNGTPELSQDETIDPAVPTKVSGHVSDTPTETEAAPSDPTDASSSEVSSLVEPLRKLGLNPAEKIALSAIALLFIGMTIWGIIWLKQKNSDASAVEELELPVEGSLAIITKFRTYWQTPGDTPGIKLGAAMVPGATITLGKESSSGALRVYFHNAEKISIGDPITIVFQDGLFDNGTDTIEISATDGFHLKGDFHAYQMDPGMAWEVEVLEADDSSAARSDFKTIIRTELSPMLR